MDIKESAVFPHKKSNNIVDLFVHRPIPDLRSPPRCHTPPFRSATKETLATIGTQGEEQGWGL